MAFLLGYWGGGVRLLDRTTLPFEGLPRLPGLSVDHTSFILYFQYSPSHCFLLLFFLSEKKVASL